MEKQRCGWATDNSLMIDYHDNDWGVPVRDDRLLFEMLNLEGAQAGLSWLTILKRRESYKQAFCNFEAEKIVKLPDQYVTKLLDDNSIIRNRLKIYAVIENSKAFIRVQKQHSSFSHYIWSFTNQHLTNKDSAKATEISQIMSKDLKNNGFKFVGPTICLSFMQSVGIINDHEENCFRYRAIEDLAS